MEQAAGPERVQQMVDVLRKWQAVERRTIDDTAQMIEACENEYLCLLMSIIQHDSLMHHQVQQFLIHCLTHGEVALSRDDLGTIWEKIEEHDKSEKKAIKMATQLRDKAWSPIHRQLLNYLLKDEEKHDALFTELNEVKSAMNRASGA